MRLSIFSLLFNKEGVFKHPSRRMMDPGFLYLSQCLPLTGTLSVRTPCDPPWLTSLSDLFAHKLHRLPDALAVCNIQQHGLQSGGGRRRQICRAFVCETCSYDVEPLSVQLPGQQVPKAAVTACDEHMLLAEAFDLVGISDVPADGSHSGHK